MSGRYCQVSMFHAHERCVMGCDFDFDGVVLATCGADDTVKLWEERSRVASMSFRTSCESVAFHPGSCTALWTAGRSGVLLWDLRMVRKNFEEDAQVSSLTACEESTSQPRTPANRRSGARPTSEPATDRDAQMNCGSWMLGGWDVDGEKPSTSHPGIDRHSTMAGADPTLSVGRIGRATHSMPRSRRSDEFNTRLKCGTYESNNAVLAECFSSNKSANSVFNRESGQYECPFTPHTTVVSRVTPFPRIWAWDIEEVLLRSHLPDHDNTNVAFELQCRGASTCMSSSKETGCLAVGNSRGTITVLY
ncbi:hypothetical protein BSKO_08194 [Bryopsis sp. KO-2023]|nr:hypothetical protein BSKO_08194 [Bryopsis sp. KO-2023]